MKKVKMFVVLLILISSLSTFNLDSAHAYRVTKTVSNVTAKADLPHYSWNGCGNFKAQSSTTRTGYKNLTHQVSFYTVGGSVSFTGGGASGSGSSPGFTRTTTGKSYSSSGNVCAGGLALYLGMFTTTKVNYQSRTYVATAKI